MARLSSLIVISVLSLLASAGAESTCQDGPQDTTCISQDLCSGVSTCCYLTGVCRNSQQANCQLGAVKDPRFPPGGGDDFVNQVCFREEGGGSGALKVGEDEAFSLVRYNDSMGAPDYSRAFSITFPHDTQPENNDDGCICVGTNDKEYPNPSLLCDELAPCGASQRCWGTL